MPKDEWRRKVEELCARERWVMDGNYSGTLELRLAACDTVIFLDLPRTLCTWRVLKRSVIYRKSTRPDMAEGCRERFDFKFLQWVWTYPKRRRPKLLARLEEIAADKQVIRLCSSDEVEKFIENEGGARHCPKS
jgi:adenylate kinase family enzyme